MRKEQKTSETHSSTTFQDDWLSEGEFKDWLKKAPSPEKAYCSVCNSTFDIANGGRSALVSHHKGKKHEKILEDRKKNAIGNFFTRVEDQQPTSSKQQQSVLVAPYDLGVEVEAAEIKWCLHMVESHLSYKSCDAIPDLFKKMFPNSPVAQHFQMKKDKARYLIVFGIYPALRANLIATINASPWYSVSFDESHNRHQQKCQMDVNVRYWNNHKNIVESSFLDSRFIYRPNAETLEEELKMSTKDLDMQKLLHLSMDGPTTNWCVLDLLDERLVESGFKQTLNIGSCTLHILHGAFRTGMQKTEWGVGKLLSALFKILDESPARRDVYLRIGDSERFPLRFCDTRWIDDVPVSNRALEIWPSIVAFINHFEGLCKSKRPQNNKSYDRLVTHRLDLLVPSKFHFFSFLARILEPYLIMFQTEMPMIPFMFDELAKILYQLLALIYRKKKLDEMKNLKDVMKESFLKNEVNFIDEMQVDIGAAAKDSLAKVSVATEKKRAFRKECRTAIQWVLLKLLERLPTNKAIVVAASCLSPKNMANIPDKSEKRCKVLVDTLYSLKFISTKVADTAKFQFSQFLKSEVALDRKKFMDFDFKKDRLDSFLYSIIGTNPDYTALWGVCKLVFIISHGQAQTERGFSINKQVTDVNMEEDSLIAQRLIYDSIKRSGSAAGEFPITKDLRKSCKLSRSRMQLDVEKKKEEAKKDERGLKRKAKLEELNDVKKARSEVEKCIITLKANLATEAIASANATSTMKAKQEASAKAAAFASQMLAKEETLKTLQEAEKNLQAEYKEMEL